MTAYRGEVSQFSTDGVVITGDFTPGDVISLRPGAWIVILTEEDAERFL
ncbi:hypothetical protein PP298_08120 [Mycobacteroides abscessus]|nr:hypothetical protein [Mycobacteroides abscessus]MDM2015307.1 hypothetical protein [Mycobacteroides abscessus]MDM2019685.1 hypothetical protein [Mycobacteroides abscessus]MDM2025106.1 hypothetical protein [Mycobacteroides abscessus]MDM2027777.1 hypothetical protein [Mycobacteroides abscessus]MDM2034038.1 hypothetical protein [Mycobacteroides abscessus]